MYNMRLLKPNREENKTIVIIEPSDLNRILTSTCGTSIDVLFIPQELMSNEDFMNAVVPSVISKKEGKIFVYRDLRDILKEQKGLVNNQNS